MKEKRNKFLAITLTKAQQKRLRPLFLEATRQKQKGTKPIIVGHANENKGIGSFDMAKFGIILAPKSVSLTKLKFTELPS